MSTRSFIGMQLPDQPLDEVTGVYHHWDGYPDGVGETLWALAQVYDTPNRLVFLCDLLFDHPQGFSSINNWAGGPDQFMSKEQYYKEGTPDYLTNLDPDDCAVYYTDGTDALMTWGTVVDSWCEWAYVIRPHNRTIGVFKVNYGNLMMCGYIDLDAPAFEHKAYQFGDGHLVTGEFSLKEIPVEKMPLGLLFAPALKAETQADANREMIKLVQYYQFHNALEQSDAEAMAKHNLGYYVGYFDSETRQRVYRLYGVTNPILGKV